MSRHRIAHDKHEVIVGWDNPMGTLFAQVYAIPAEPLADDEDEEMLLWAGLNYHEIQTVQELRDRLADYAEIPAEIAAILESEMAQAIPRTKLQENVRAIFEDLKRRRP